MPREPSLNTQVTVCWAATLLPQRDCTNPLSADVPSRHNHSVSNQYSRSLCPKIIAAAPATETRLHCASPAGPESPRDTQLFQPPPNESHAKRGVVNIRISRDQNNVCLVVFTCPHFRQCCRQKFYFLRLNHHAHILPHLHCLCSRMRLRVSGYWSERCFNSR